MARQFEALPGIEIGAAASVSRTGSEAVAVSRGLDKRGGVGRQQQPLGDEGGRGGLDLGDIGRAAAVTLFERRPRVVGGVALGPGARKGDERAVAIGGSRMPAVSLPSPSTAETKVS